MLYGCETWCLTKTEETRLAVAQRKIERRMLNVRLLDQHPREWLRERTQLKDIVQAARERKWNYLRKLMLLPDDRWNRKLTEWTPNTRRYVENSVQLSFNAATLEWEVFGDENSWIYSITEENADLLREGYNEQL
uniref:Endonuclease-reverse transcriptase n=1 Tax=Panagrolaimus davidi TaxID=227884 RepID=A0A914PDS9_9BILA